MGVYIKGMEMPKSFKDIRIYADGRIVSKSLYMYGEEIATAVPVPPHGRLIDADALRADWLENGENEYVYDTNAFLDSIDAAPTIIQAEENDRSVIYCKECRVVQTCPCQKEKDERAGNPFKEVMGCNKGIPTIIPAEEGE